MAQQITRSVQPRWRDSAVAGRRQPVLPTARTRRALVLATFLLSGLATCGGILSWYVGQPKTYFASCWVTSFRDPTIPPNTAAEHDRQSMVAGQLFAGANIASMPIHSRFRIQQQLDSLVELKANIVLYAGTYAMLDEHGGIVLLSSDFESGNPATGLPLVKVLRALADSPSRHKLLILDIFSPVERGQLTGVPGTIADRLAAELAAVPDPHRLVLTSCSPGQVAWSCETNGRTVFNFYLELAFRGGADGYQASRQRDGRISVREAAAMVRAKVDRWALQSRAARQTPELLGEGEDFELTVYDGTDPTWPELAKAPVYPNWLLAAWRVRDAWLESGVDRLAPRSCRQLEASLLRIESKWRWGDPVDRLEAKCQARLADLQHQVDLARQQVSGPPAASLAVAAAHQTKTDPRAAAAVTQWLSSGASLPAPTAAEWQASRSKLLAEFDKQTKDVSDLDIALAVVDTAVVGTPLNPPQLESLVAVLQRRNLTDHWIETRALARLTEQTHETAKGGWSADDATRLFRIIQRSEQVFGQNETIPWMLPLLDAGANSRHDAEVCVHWRRFVPADTLTRVLAQAEADCQQAFAHEQVLVLATNTYEQALRILPWYATYLERCGADQAAWEAATSAVESLGSQLQSAVAGQSRAQRPARQFLESLQRATADTDGALKRLLRPFSSTHVLQLQARCVAADTRAETVSELDAVLATPLLLAADREVLCNARTQLTRRFTERVWQLDQDEMRNARQTSVLAGFDAAAAVRAAVQASALRDKVRLDLLQLGGIAPTSTEQQVTATDNASADAATSLAIVQLLTRHLREVLQSGDLAVQDRAARIFPPLQPLRLLDDVTTNPTVRRVAARCERLWAWSAERFRYETQDGPDCQFFAALAALYAGYLRSTPRPGVQIDGPTTLADVQPGGQPVTCPLAWTITAAAPSTQPASFSILNPALPWLTISAPSPAGPGATSPLDLSVRLSAGARFTQASPAGFMLRWQVAGRSFHRVVAVPGLADLGSFQVRLSHAKDPGGPAVERFVLRPNLPPQTYYLHITNLGSVARKVLVRLSCGVTSTATEVGPGQTAAIAFASPPAGKSAPPSGTTADPFQELPGPLRCTLLDAATHRVLNTATIPVEVLVPRQLISVDRVRFIPASDRHNRLELELRGNQSVPGPPCSVKLDLKAAQIPGLLGHGNGLLQGQVPADGSPLTLFVSDLRLADGPPDQGRFQVTVDGTPRTLIFDTTFARGGDAVTPVEATRPAVRLVAPTAGRSGAPFSVQIESDYAPASGTIQLELGQPVLPHGFRLDRTVQLPAARDCRVTMAAGSQGPAIQLKASVSDWNVPLDTSGVVGRRLLRARLLSLDKRELAVAEQWVTLGNQPPQGVRFVDLPAEASNLRPLAVTASALDSLPDVTEVTVFLGKPNKDSIPKGVLTVPATATDATHRTWTASVPLKKTDVGPVPVSVQFTNAAGLSSFATTTVTLTDKDLSRGAIHGHVLEGSIPQVGIEVVLKGPDGKSRKATTVTNGSFSFSGLKPGQYALTARKPASGRSGTATANVAEGETATAQIELWL